MGGEGANVEAMTSPTNPTDKLVEALKHARGWVVTCSESAKARRDLKEIDAALDAYRSRAQDDGVTMLVGQEWLDRKTASDPDDADCEVRPPLIVTDKLVEAVARALCISRDGLDLSREKDRKYLEGEWSDWKDEARAALEAALARSGPAEHDREELLDTIADAIGDSMDMDWNYRDGARSVLAALVAENIVKVKP